MHKEPKFTRALTFDASLCVCTLGVFVTEASRGLFIPSMWAATTHVGKGVSFLGISVSVFSLGRLIASAPFGKLADKYGSRIPLFATSALAMGSCVLYMWSMEHASATLLLISRFLAGTSGGCLAIARGEAAHRSHADNRMFTMAVLALAQFAGFGLCPLLMYGSGNALYVPAITMLALNVLLVFSVAVFLQEDYPTVFVDVQRAYEDDRDFFVSDEASDEVHHVDQSLVARGVAVFTFLNFSSRGVISVIETAGAPMLYSLHDEQGVDAMVKTACMFYGKLGCIGIATFCVTVLTRNLISEVACLLFGFCTITAGVLLLTLQSLVLEDTASKLGFFYVGTALVWSVGFPIKQTTLLTAFSRILGGRPQGSMMGWIQTAGSVARVSMPIATGFLPFWQVWVISLMLCAVSLVLLLWYMSSARSGEHRKLWL